MDSQDKIEVNYYPLSMEESSSSGTAEKPASNTSAVALPSSNILQSSVGSVMVGNAIQSGNFAKGASGWKLDSDGNIEANDGNFRGDITGASGTFTGTVTVGEINIGGDDATSAHIDTDGNFWTGASVANKAIAPARINKDGTAYFTGVTTMGSGTDEFSQISWDSTNMKVNGSYIKNYDVFGSGKDGDVTLNAGGTTTLTSDVYYNNLTITNTTILNPNGYRIFVKEILTIDNGSKILLVAGNGGDGANATAGGSGAGGTAGTALSNANIYGGLAGQIGGNGGTGTAGTAGTNQTESVGLNGTRGGNGGALSNNGAAGTITATKQPIENSYFATILREFTGEGTVKYIKGCAGSGSGGGGKVAGDGKAGGGGGSGATGGIILLSAKKIIVNPGGYIQSIGGNGGKGGNGYAGSASYQSGGGGGGGAGAGGILIIQYSLLTNNGTISCPAGTPGLKGTGLPNSGYDGEDAPAGNDGRVIYLQK